MFAPLVGLKSTESILHHIRQPWVILIAELSGPVGEIRFVGCFFKQLLMKTAGITSLIWYKRHVAIPNFIFTHWVMGTGQCFLRCCIIFRNCWMHDGVTCNSDSGFQSQLLWRRGTFWLFHRVLSTPSGLGESAHSALTAVPNYFLIKISILMHHLPITYNWIFKSICYCFHSF